MPKKRRKGASGDSKKAQNSAALQVVPESQKRKTGRPSEYSEEVALRICERMVEGESLRSICRDLEMPGLTTVFRWKDAHEGFRKRYAHAREMQAEVLAEEIIEIADTPRIGVRRKMTPRGPEYVEIDMVERSRLMVDSRKWAASKILPKRYGEPSQRTGESSDDPLNDLLKEFRRQHGELNGEA